MHTSSAILICSQILKRETYIPSPSFTKSDCRLAGSVNHVFWAAKQQDHAFQLVPRLLPVSCMLENLSSGTISITFHMPSGRALGIECCWLKCSVSLTDPHQVLHRGLASRQGFVFPAFEGLSELVYCSEL